MLIIFCKCPCYGVDPAIFFYIGLLVDFVRLAYSIRKLLDFLL